jgi:hypothetical protein
MNYDFMRLDCQATHLSEMNYKRRDNDMKLFAKCKFVSIEEVGA